MAIKIGHAAGDERRGASGGKAGDQTGGEITLGRWYSSPWDAVLRPTDPGIAEKSALACEAACANPRIGYDQSQRNTLYEKAVAANFDLGAIEEPCECDCSSLMHVCAMAGGANVPFKWNCFWTGNMEAGFLASGQYVVLKDEKYLISDKWLRRGDILLNSKSHTAMALEDGAMAEPEENGQGGTAGSLSPAEDDVEAGGEEKDSAAPVTPSQSADADSSPQRGEPVTMLTPLPLLKMGHIGGAVWAMQTLLSDRGYSTGGVDSEFGPKTDAALRRFQSAKALETDGECGAKSWAALIQG